MLFWKKIPNDQWINVAIVAVVLAIGYATYFHNYWLPQGFFWDENYHVVSAQKYLNGIFFMETHPPLGKILMALGERLIHSNDDNLNQALIDVDYAKKAPEGLSLAGYRFFPVLCAWWGSLIVLANCWLITHNRWWALGLTTFYLFDNALIVHFRGAMLDGFLICFINLSLLFFLLLCRREHHNLTSILIALGLGTAIALAVGTKLTGLVMILLIPAAMYRLRAQGLTMVQLTLMMVVGFSLSSWMVWQTHFSLAQTVNPLLRNNGFYDASPTYQRLLEEGNPNPLYFPLKLRDYMAYSQTYNSKVPKLNLCKPDENGSPFFQWPFGGRAINYRWQEINDTYSYLYLQGNPVIWYLGLFGVIFTTAIALVSLLNPLHQPLQQQFLLFLFLSLYWGYMIAISQIDRVMYLYHYFPPLMFSFYLFAIALQEIKTLGKWNLSPQRKSFILAFLSGLIMVSFWFYSPLTYSKPLTNDQFQQRVLSRWWGLRCAKCPHDHPTVIIED